MLFVDAAGVYAHNNFDELKASSLPHEALRMVYHSLRNLRKVPNFDVTNRTLNRNCDLMKRTSYLAEIELHYIYALQSPNAHIGKGSPYFSVIADYIDNFHYKFDVIHDLRPFLALLDIHEDGQELHDRFKVRIEATGSSLLKTEELASSDGAKANKPVMSLTLLRWKFMHYKTNKVIGMYSHFEDAERLERANEIFAVFL